MTFTIILAILFGAIGGAGFMGLMSSRAYDKGYEDGVTAQLYVIVEEEDEE